MTIEETRTVLKALWIIKNECNGNYGHCDECRMFNRGKGSNCSLQYDDPCKWELPPLPEKKAMFTV